MLTYVPQVNDGKELSDHSQTGLQNAARGRGPRHHLPGLNSFYRDLREVAASESGR